MALSAKAFRLPWEPGRRGPPNPSAVSRRSAVWVPGADGLVAEAVRRQDAPRSTGSRAAAARGRAATWGPRAVWPAGGRPPRSIAHRPPACPAGVPLAPRGNGGTTRVDGRARSTACRTGSTPGSPDQRSPGDDAGLESGRLRSGAIRHHPGDDAGRESGRPRSGAIQHHPGDGPATKRPRRPPRQHQRLHMAIHNFHRFIHNRAPGMHGHQLGLYRLPWAASVDNPRVVRLCDKQPHPLPELNGLPR